MLLPDVEQHVVAQCLGPLRVGGLEVGDGGREARVEALGDVDVLVEARHRVPELLLLEVERGVVLAELVLAVAQRVQDAVEVLLGGLVLAEVVGRPGRRRGACPSSFLAPVASLGSRSSTVRRSSSRVEPTLDPSERPPSWSARTGDFSSRLRGLGRLADVAVAHRAHVGRLRRELRRARRRGHQRVEEAVDLRVEARQGSRPRRRVPSGGAAVAATGSGGGGRGQRER